MKIHDIKTGETLSDDVKLTFLEISGEKPGLTLGLISGIHGDELSSIGGLIRFLEGANKVNSKLTGKILALPFANPFGLRRREHTALNRIFPGNPTGSSQERIAWAIFSFFEKQKADLLIDIHVMNPLSIPHIVIPVDLDNSFPLRERVLSMADMFGLGIVYYRYDALSTSSVSTFLRFGIPAFAVEVPGVFYSPSDGESIIENGLWNMVYGLNMIPADGKSLWEHPTKGSIGVGAYSSCRGPRVKCAGFFRRCISLGDWVNKGQVLGEILDVALKVAEKVIAETSGYIADIMDGSIVSTGDQPIDLFIPENP